MLDFTAIDFETATKSYHSACSVAIVEVRGGNVVDSFYTLIKPPGMRFSSVNIGIHGITPSMVEKAQDFAGVWPTLEG